ncbi:PWWP domain-containing DNA repair factor 3A isoform X2 [Manis pentadactyla]|uniref:PWWP domain-containing DNA repair factor 3A isoform X2 n=1 Tax=Manis pentadactyla TaxID=143292 RepID=UPI00255C3795|nr:PWWP domain-containing DNA repair factor 3A isoform X2 [Manis pentadactyla]
MTDAEYVLCRWESRLWPAKVLARTEMSTKNKRKKEFLLTVQILSLDKKIKVKSAEAQTLEQSHIEDIASSLGSPNQVPTEPLEELVYRRSLRVGLDVLNNSTGPCQESSSREGRTALSPREKPMERASSGPCDPSASPPSPQDVSDGAEGKARVHQRLLGSLICEKDPKCKADQQQGLGKSESPRGLVVSSAGGPQEGSGSKTHRKSRTTPSKGGRVSAQEPHACQNAPSSSEGGRRGANEEEAGGPASPSSPSKVREGGVWARGPDPGQPAGSPTVLPASRHLACPDTQGRPAKRRCPDGSQRPPVELEPGTAPSPKRGPRRLTTLKLGLPTLHVPAEETSYRAQEEAGCPRSEESMEFGSIDSTLEEDEEDEEPPRILLYPEPRSFEVGMLVWLKHQKYPFWPAVVKSVRRRDRKASVLFIEGHMDPKGRGITVPLRRLKHFDCKEKQALLKEAKEGFDQAIGWCVSLITDYRVRLGCGSFSGSFLEYYAADISYPVRKSIQQDVLGTRFPQLSAGGLREPVAGVPQGRRHPPRKVLPDRSRAARDRANQKLVEYIVKARGAERHLQAILKNRKPSRWLKMFLNSGQYVTCVETYLEDEEQLDLVVEYLQRVYQEAGSRAPVGVSSDRIRFILDVLLPELMQWIIRLLRRSTSEDLRSATGKKKYLTTSSWKKGVSTAEASGGTRQTASQ